MTTSRSWGLFVLGIPLYLTLGLAWELRGEPPPSARDTPQGETFDAVARVIYPDRAFDPSIMAERAPGPFTVPQGYIATNLKYHWADPKTGRESDRITAGTIYYVPKRRYVTEAKDNPRIHLPQGEYQVVCGGFPGAIGVLTYTVIREDLAPPPTDVAPPPTLDPKKRRPADTNVPGNDESVGRQAAPAYFLRIPRDLPAGWWHAVTELGPKNQQDGVPYKKSDNPWNQQFYMSQDQGFIRKNGRWTDPSNSRREFSQIWVWVTIYDANPGPAGPVVAKAVLDSFIKEPGARYLDATQQSVLMNTTPVAGSQHYIRIVFYHCGHEVWMQLSSKPGTSSDGTEELALQFANRIRGHIDDHLRLVPAP